ncbi:WD40-repeat-containing domain protein [Syncephalastrum racemosum]|uniref:WD40-repeat-containing domain protein n=1 Tax=Syncephalastrum racemosum TaxID=13706 RepID=A0A1X2H3W8_SYNRA|nr:WD40-repeat-containing domain protein [Syncephalastrum racemosum]
MEYAGDFDLQSEEHEKIINEEYKTWKKNSPFLYDLLISHALEWPSLTCQWFPEVEERSEDNCRMQRLLLGTHTNDDDRNYVQIATVRVPNEPPSADDEDTDKDVNGYGARRSQNGFGEDDNMLPYDSLIQIEQKIVHEGEVNRARYMTDNSDIIATKSRGGDVYIFDRKRYSSFPKVFERFEPTIQLLGHDKEGYGLAWNPHKSRSSHLLSAGFDSRICQWDIQSSALEKRSLNAMRIYEGHSAAVEDVAWHTHYENVFASVGDDSKMLIWDTRNESNTKPVYNVHAHEAEINCVAFCPGSEWVVATGSGDKTAALWDMRNLKRKLHELHAHSAEILQLAWSPHHEAVLATAGNDRRVLIWDLSRLGQEQSADEAEDGPPELLFMHGGHTNKISDFGWNPADPWMLASTAEDNIVQVWQMASNIHNDDLESATVEDKMDIDQPAGADVKKDAEQENTKVTQDEPKEAPTEIRPEEQKEQLPTEQGTLKDAQEPSSSAQLSQQEDQSQQDKPAEASSASSSQQQPQQGSQEQETRKEDEAAVKGEGETNAPQ